MFFLYLGGKMKNVFHLSKSFEIIKAFTKPNEILSHSDIARKTGISWSQSNKLVNDLIASGYLVDAVRQNMRNKPVKLSESGVVLYYVIYELSAIINKNIKGDEDGEKNK